MFQSCEKVDSTLFNNISTGLNTFYPNNIQSFLFLKAFAGRSLFLGACLWGLESGFSSDIFNSFGPLVYGFSPYFGYTLNSLQHFCEFFNECKIQDSNAAHLEIKHASLEIINNTNDSTIVESEITPINTSNFIDKIFSWNNKLFYGIGVISAVGVVYVGMSLLRNSHDKTTVEVYNILTEARKNEK